MFNEVQTMICADVPARPRCVPTAHCFEHRSRAHGVLECRAVPCRAVFPLSGRVTGAGAAFHFHQRLVVLGLRMPAVFTDASPYTPMAWPKRVYLS
jgi:hypothetical protein